MASSFQGTVGMWARFDRYEVRDGYIRPAPGAHLEPYDPWQAYRDARPDGALSPAPYESLLDLLQSIGSGVTLSLGAMGRPFVVSPAAASAIADWCGTWGLLGILPHRVEAVALASTWEQLNFGPQAQGPADFLVPTVTRFVRSSTGWKSNTTSYMGNDSFYLVQEPEARGTPVDAQHYPARAVRPGVLIRDLRSSDWKEEPLTETWATFFPDVPEAERTTYRYPSPLSQDFWNLYAEPVDFFISAASALREALDGLQRLKPVDEANEEDRVAITVGHGLLSALIAGVSPTMELTDDGFIEPLWVATSLLASLSMMAFLDLSERKGRLLRCEVCGRLFFSAAWQARYCSLRCRNRAQKRAYRRRHPPAGPAKSEEA